MRPVRKCYICKKGIKNNVHWFYNSTRSVALDGRPTLEVLPVHNRCWEEKHSLVRGVYNETH